MEKIEFNSNVEFVAKAKALLEDPEGYPYGWSKDRDQCQYLTEEGNRCIAGRMFYGHVSEQNLFWQSTVNIEFLSRSKEKGDLAKRFPFLDFNKVVKPIQNRHDAAARHKLSTEGKKKADFFDGQLSWEKIEEYAKQADKLYQETE